MSSSGRQESWFCRIHDFEYFQQVATPRRCGGLTNRMHYLQPVWLFAVAHQVSCRGVEIFPSPFLVEEASGDHVKFVRAVQACLLPSFGVDAASCLLQFHPERPCFRTLAALPTTPHVLALYGQLLSFVAKEEIRFLVFVAPPQLRYDTLLLQPLQCPKQVESASFPLTSTCARKPLLIASRMSLADALRLLSRGCSILFLCP